MAIAETKRDRISRIVGMLLLGGYALIFSRLLDVHITQAETFAGLQESMAVRLSYKYGRSQFERGRRGTIYDSRGTPLALGFDTYRLIVDPNAPSQRPAPPLDERLRVCADALAVIGFEFDRSEFFRRGREQRMSVRSANGEIVERPRRHRVLVDGLLPYERDYLAQVLKRRDPPVPGFTFEAESEREYPSGGLASEIVGFVGESKDETHRGPRGRAGIEWSLDRILAGNPGAFQCKKDGLGREYDLDGFWIERPQKGRDIGLSLNLEVQSILDEALAKAFGELDADAISGVVLETQTGRILAMAGRPVATVDDIRAGTATFIDTLSRPATQIGPPGSTLKPFVLARAIEWGLVGWDETWDVRGGVATLKKGRVSRRVHDSTPHEILTTSEVITKSSNIAMARIGLNRVGPKRMHELLCSFGFGERSGILLPSEPRGHFAKLADIQPLWFATSTSYGQEISMTPLQLAARFSIFGTKGVYHEPRIVDWIGDDEKRVENARKSQRLLRAPLAERMREVLAQTVTDGTAHVLKNLPWTVAAKTGTAQILDKHGHQPGFNSSVVALAPAVNPEITVHVVVHGVKGQRFYGGSTAGPAVRDVIEKTLRRLGVPSDKNGLDQR